MQRGVAARASAAGFFGIFCVRRAVSAQEKLLVAADRRFQQREPLFEQTLWRGYLANDVVYEAISAASRTPAEAEAMKKLAPLFQRLDEMTLHAWVESKLPIGPRIGVKNLPEELLSALGRWHLSSFQRQREDVVRAKAESRATWEMRLKWLSFGLAIPTAIIAILKFASVG